MRIANTVNDSIVDGHGLRFTIFTQGCPHHCPRLSIRTPTDPRRRPGGFPGGTDSGDGAQSPIEGVTFSGGGTLCPGGGLRGAGPGGPCPGAECLDLFRLLFEHLRDSGNPDWTALLAQTDVLVDGPFWPRRSPMSSIFRGSRNQRLIDVPRSLAQGRVVLWQEEDPWPSSLCRSPERRRRIP